MRPGCRIVEKGPCRGAGEIRRLFSFRRGDHPRDLRTTELCEALAQILKSFCFFEKLTRPLYGACFFHVQRLS